MPKPILCWVTDRRALSLPAVPASQNSSDSDRETALIARARDVASAGVEWIQLREKDLDARPLSHLACAILSAVPPRTRLLINDRLDVAWSCGAAGVHLGEASLPVAEAACEIARRKASPSPQDQAPDFLLGVSCHSLDAVRLAADAGANYVFFGPVFATPSKAAFGPPQGLRRLAEACRAVSIPVLAIGGITPENSSSCVDAGAAGLAAIRMFQNASDRDSLSALVERLSSPRALR